MSLTMLRPCAGCGLHKAPYFLDDDDRCPECRAARKADDPVSHPSHYTAGPIECIDAIESALGPEGFAAFLRASCLKYLWRGPHKGNPRQDYEKCRWYLSRLIERTPES